jgi:hypothetical protein
LIYLRAKLCLLIEVDSWCDFTRHFLHLKNEESPKNKVLVLTAVLAERRLLAHARCRFEPTVGLHRKSTVYGLNGQRSLPKPWLLSQDNYKEKA